MHARVGQNVKRSSAQLQGIDEGLFGITRVLPECCPHCETWLLPAPGLLPSPGSASPPGLGHSQNSVTYRKLLINIQQSVFNL